MKRATAWFLVLIAICPTAAGQTFGGPFPQIIVVDNFAGSCLAPIGTAVKVVTVPGGLPLISSIQIVVGLNHTFIGDVNFTIAHGATTVSLIGPVLPCAGVGDSSDLLGLYTFDDAAATTLDTAALATGGLTVIPPGSYIGDNPLAAFLGADPTGPWTFTVWDQSGGVTGTFFDARLILGCPTSYTVSQAAPGAPVAIAHTCGFPGNGYLSAFELGPAGVPNGWFFGLDIAMGNLLGQISLGPPFFGSLDFLGSAVFAIGGVPPGLTVSSVGLHFDIATGVLIFASDPFTYTTI